MWRVQGRWFVTDGGAAIRQLAGGLAARGWTLGHYASGESGLFSALMPAVHLLGEDTAPFSIDLDRSGSNRAQAASEVRIVAQTIGKLPPFDDLRVSDAASPGEEPRGVGSAAAGAVGKVGVGAADAAAAAPGGFLFALKTWIAAQGAITIAGMALLVWVLFTPSGKKFAAQLVGKFG